MLAAVAVFPLCSTLMHVTVSYAAFVLNEARAKTSKLVWLRKCDMRVPQGGNYGPPTSVSVNIFFSFCSVWIPECNLINFNKYNAWLTALTACIQQSKLSNSRLNAKKEGVNQYEMRLVDYLKINLICRNKQQTIGILLRCNFRPLSREINVESWQVVHRKKATIMSSLCALIQLHSFHQESLSEMLVLVQSSTEGQNVYFGTGGQTLERFQVKLRINQCEIPLKNWLGVKWAQILLREKSLWEDYDFHCVY